MTKPDIPEAEREERSGDGRRKPRIYVPFYILDGAPHEAIRLNGKNMFLYYEGGCFKAKTFLEREDGVRVFPIQNHQYEYEFQAIPEDLNIPSLKELFNETLWFVENFFVHFDERIQKFLALYLIHSYILILSPGTIFIWLIGAKRSGKTTLQNLAERLGYRALSGVNPSEPAIYRSLGCHIEYGPLIVIREYNFASQFMRELAREGDIPGTRVPRVDEIEGAREVAWYYIYGARIVASNRLHGDEADMDRYFVINTIRAKPRLSSANLYRDFPTIERLRRLRNNLLLWKLMNYQTLTIPLDDPKREIQDGRDWNHYGGIIYLAFLIGPELETEIRNLIKEYIAKKEEEEKKFSLPALLFKIIYELCDEKHKFGSRYRVASQEIWDKLSEELSPVYENGVVVSNKLIGPDGKLLTRERVSKIIKEQLLGQRDRWFEKGPDGEERRVRGFVWDHALLERLKYSFDYRTGQVDQVDQVLGRMEEGETYSSAPSLHGDNWTSPFDIIHPLNLVRPGQPGQSDLTSSDQVDQVGPGSSQKMQENRGFEGPSHVDMSYPLLGPDRPGQPGQPGQDEQLPSKESVTDITDYDRFKDKNTDLEEKERRFHSEPPLPSTPPSNPEKSVTSVISVIYSHAEPGSSISPGGNNQLPPKEYVGALKPESSILTQTHEEKLPPYMESLIERGLISKNEDGSWSCRVCGKMRLKEFQTIWLHVVLCENSHKNEVVMKR